jgi:hypothetical protein
MQKMLGNSFAVNTCNNAGWTDGEKRLLLRPGFTQCRIQVPIRLISVSVLRALSVICVTFNLKYLPVVSFWY